MDTQPAADLSAFMVSLRGVTAQHGAAWVQAQLAQVIREADGGLQSRGARPSARRRRPPERLSPGVPSRSRRVRSPSQDPPAPPGRHSSPLHRSRAGRNPAARRGSGRQGEGHVAPSSPSVTASVTGPAAAGPSHSRKQGAAQRRSRAGTRSQGEKLQPREVRRRRSRAAADPGGEAFPSTSQGAGRRVADGVVVPSTSSVAASPPVAGGSSGQRVQVALPTLDVAGEDLGAGPSSLDDESDSLEDGEVRGAATAEVRSRIAAVPASAESQPDGGCLTWILGHSYVRRGAARADVRPSGRQLGFQRSEVRIRWIGVGGLLWSGVLPEFHFHARLDRPPDILVLHVGGNDIGVRASRELIRDIKFDILRLWSMFPGVVIVWSEVVARFVWRQARSVDKLNRARGRINREVSRFVARNGGVVVRHRELEVPAWGFMDADGIHLNEVGTDLWCSDLQDGIEKAIRVWRDSQAQGVVPARCGGGGVIDGSD
ncbi:uncharacterized protein [Dendropsophus ebraccatus]|uniref:uncharacterized protein n=1 Tax=Dendropsophus ebraccatus TaxID=150705 RepID=UPI00383222F1